MSGYKNPEQDFALASAAEDPISPLTLGTIPDAFVRAHAELTARTVRESFYTQLWRPMGNLLVHVAYDGPNLHGVILASQHFGGWEETTVDIAVDSFGEVERVKASFSERMTPPRTFELGDSDRDLSAVSVIGSLYRIRSASRKAARAKRTAA